MEQAFAQQDFSKDLCHLAELPATRWGINDVMLMSEDQTLHQNHITLLAQLHSLMNRITDLSHLPA